MRAASEVSTEGVDQSPPFVVRLPVACGTLSRTAATQTIYQISLRFQREIVCAKTRPVL